MSRKMIRTKYPYGYKLPYGTIHKVTCNLYRKKKFIFLRIEDGKAVVFHDGRRKRSSFTLYIDPKKIIVPKKIILALI